MEVVIKLKGGFQQFSRFPSEFVVTNPTDNVFQSFSDKLGIQYLFNIKFYIVVDDHRRWDRLHCPGRGLFAASSSRDT